MHPLSDGLGVLRDVFRRSAPIAPRARRPGAEGQRDADDHAGGDVPHRRQDIHSTELLSALDVHLPAI
jgi:hypothetical protein